MSYHRDDNSPMEIELSYTIRDAVHAFERVQAKGQYPDFQVFPIIWEELTNQQQDDFITHFQEGLRMALEDIDLNELVWEALEEMRQDMPEEEEEEE